eukprot:GHUV01021666.1.p1 GENE.GHUV01021666.1~~GHUV01021666.1.p1  ORF type:complete len:204 (+),score=40.69 GHUV01021666.1:977-1588(+)
MSALHARPGGDLRLLARGKLLNQHVARFTPPIRAQQNRNEWQLRLARYSAVFRQFAAARQWQWQDVRSSLCIGVGARSLACYGGSGPNGPSSGAGGSGGSGGDGWHAGPGHSSISNVLSDVAAVNDGSSDTAEQVILLDVGGMKCGGCVGHVKKLLEEHPAVLQATVNLATETALVRVTLTQGADLDKLAADLAQVGPTVLVP